MTRHLFTAALLVSLSGFGAAQAVPSSGPKFVRASFAEDQASKDEKKAEKRDQKDEKKSAKEARKQRDRDKKEAKRREKELKRQNDQMKKVRDQEKHDRDLQIKQAKDEQKNRKQYEKDQRKGVATAEVPRDHDQDQIARERHDRDQKAAEDRDRMAREEREREEREHQQAVGTQNHAAAPPPVVTNGDHQRELDRQRDAELARERDRDRDRYRDQQAQLQRDRDYDRLREQNERYRRELDRLRQLPRPRSPYEAQQHVESAFTSELPNYPISVFVNNANQIVMRGSVPGPSWKQRLLGLATAAAGGYGLVDQLASDAVTSAAGSATSAAIGGIGGLLHHDSSDSGSSGYNNYSATPSPSGSYNSTPAYGAPSAAPDNSSYNNPPSYSGGSYSNSRSAIPVALAAGSNVCINVNANNQLLLTGQVPSQLDAQRVEQFASRLASRNATIINQLAGMTPDAAGAATANAPSAASSVYNAVAPISSGSTVCVNSSNNQLMLTGTVPTQADAYNVEQAAAQLAGSANAVVNQLTTSGTGAAPINDTAGDLQSGLQRALGGYAALSSVSASVSADTVLLTGSVGNDQDRQMARQIAQSYAGGRRVVDNMAVATGRQ